MPRLKQYVWVCCVLLTGCFRTGDPTEPITEKNAPPGVRDHRKTSLNSTPKTRLSAGSTEMPTTDPRAERTRERLRMVQTQLKARNITDPRLLQAMAAVPRHAFIPSWNQTHAYGDHPLRIGHQQTISQPYIVALMTEALKVKPGHRVLEIGTGSGYQAAVLAELVETVFTIEIVEALAQRSEATLNALGYGNIRFRTGDGYVGWPDAAPFDRILLTAAPPEIPQPLLEQLRVGGILVAPVGRSRQELVRVRRTASGLKRERLMGVRFVPMTGEAQAQP